MNKKSRCPVQKRSIDKKNKIIEAGEYLFSKKGFYKTNSKDIATHADVAIGSFYAYFKNKKEVLLEALKRYSEKIFLNVKKFQDNNILDISNPNLFIIDLINNVIDSHKILPEFHEEIHFLMHTDPDIKKIMQLYLDQSIQVTYNLLNNIRDNLKVKDIDTASTIITVMIEEIVHFIIFNSKNHEQTKLINGLSDMINSYLF